MQQKNIWLLTRRGGKFTTKLAAAVSVALFGYEVAPHTLNIPYSRVNAEKAMVQVIGSKELPLEVRGYVRRAIDDMKFTEDQRKALTVHLADSAEMSTKGCVDSVFGAHVNLPWTIWSGYEIKEQKLADSTEEQMAAVERLRDSFKWSDKAKLFLTAYQCSWAKQKLFFIHGLNTSFMAATAYAAAYQVSRKYLHDQRSTKAAVLINSVVLLLCYGFWAFLTDFTTCKVEGEVIKEVCSLGQDYADGAIEIFHKKQQHNLAVRDLLGFMGKFVYTKTGNAFYFRKKSLALEERIDLVEQIVEQWRSANVATDTVAT